MTPLKTRNGVIAFQQILAMEDTAVAVMEGNPEEICNSKAMRNGEFMENNCFENKYEMRMEPMTSMELADYVQKVVQKIIADAIMLPQEKLKLEESFDEGAVLAKAESSLNLSKDQPEPVGSVQKHRPGIALNLPCRGQKRLARNQVEYRLLPAHAHRKVRRAGAAVRIRVEGFLHNAVLERMIADDHEAPARIEPADGGVETSTQHVQLRVDFYPKRLERPFRRMPPARRAEAGMAALMTSTSCSLVSILPFARDRTMKSAMRLAHSCVGVGTDDPSEICCVVGVHDLCCG